MAHTRSRSRHGLEALRYAELLEGAGDGPHGAVLLRGENFKRLIDRPICLPFQRASDQINGVIRQVEEVGEGDFLNLAVVIAVGMAQQLDGVGLVALAALR